jgi:hypothetical protein
VLLIFQGYQKRAHGQLKGVVYPRIWNNLKRQELLPKPKELGIVSCANIFRVRVKIDIKQK